MMLVVCKVPAWHSFRCKLGAAIRGVDYKVLYM